MKEGSRGKTGIILRKKLEELEQGILFWKEEGIPLPQKQDSVLLPIYLMLPDHSLLWTFSEYPGHMNELDQIPY